MSRAGEFSCPLHAAAVFVAHVNADAALRLATSCEAHLQLLNSIANAPILQHFTNMLDLDSVLAAAEEPSCVDGAGCLPPVAHVSTPNGAAHLVEFAPHWQQHHASSEAPAGLHLRPVAWFAFLSRQQRVEWVAAQPALQEGPYSEDEEEEDDEEGVVNIFQNARRQSTKHRHTYVFSLACIFAYVLCAYHRHAHAVATARFCAPLQRPHAGNLLIVKMIACENLMQEHEDDHPEPNIDVSYVVPFGKQWTLWPSLRLASNG